MKTIRNLILTGMTVAGLCGARTVGAQTTSATTTPLPPTTTTVVPNGGVLKGIPENIKVLIIDFAVIRDKYLAHQDLLLLKLSKATTEAERQQIRAQLEDNRAAFLDEIKAFRLQLKGDLEALKGKINHAEFLRIINAAYDAIHEGGFYQHKGH
ncbi:MAG: hypothetical protein ABSE48_15550 [Verrucomicrobiota bacterium]|jgi:hypothetical protein